jgi:hypothetical protein
MLPDKRLQMSVVGLHRPPGTVETEDDRVAFRRVVVVGQPHEHLTPVPVVFESDLVGSGLEGSSGGGYLLRAP